MVRIDTTLIAAKPPPIVRSVRNAHAFASLVIPPIGDYNESINYVMAQ